MAPTEPPEPRPARHPPLATTVAVVLGAGGFVLLVVATALVGGVVLGVLLLGLWRRAAALLAELADLADRLHQVGAALDGDDPGKTSGRPLLSGRMPSGGHPRP